MKLGGLFSGIGGFEEAWRRNGGEVAWMCEVDPKARQVLEARFPGVPIYPDVTELDPAEVEPVDVLSGGSPCQGFSMAGARTGLQHGESRLFADHVRIMDGLAERGLQWAVWENVPGVLSITNDEQEYVFEHVVAALVGADQPVRLSRGTRWNTGLADRGGRAVAWRVVDSRHFGVPQRRRRVYAVVAFGGAAADRAGRALLAKPEGVRGDTAACGQTGQDVAGTLGASVDRGSGGGGVRNDIDAMTFVPDEPFTFDRANITSRLNRTRVGPGLPSNTLAPGSDINAVVPNAAACLTTGTGLRMDAETETLVPQPVYGMTGGTGDESAFPEQQPALTASHGQPGNVAVPAVLLTMREGKDGGGKGPLLAEDESLTLATGNGQVLFDPVPLKAGGHSNANGAGIGRPGDPAGTLDTTGLEAVGPVPIQNAATRTESAAKTPSPDAQGRVRLRDPGLGIGEPGDPQYTLDATSPHAVGPVAFAWQAGGDGTTSLPLADDGGTPTLTRNQTLAATTAYGVRRLTPTECERLQGFDDGWTEPAGSDSARYKALGNAVTVNVPQWLFARMLEVGL